MTPETIGIIGIVVLLCLFLLRVPIAFGMAIVGLAGFMYLSDAESALSLLAQDMSETLSAYPLSVIPMFILMGSFAFASGISRRLYSTSYTWFGQFRGGLTIATVIACSGFSAICGSTAATAATMGKIALPEMKKYGYDVRLSAGCIAASGTVAVLIPPSTILIIYAVLTETSVGEILMAGYIPGLVSTLVYMCMIAVRVKLNPQIAPTPSVAFSWATRIKSMAQEIVFGSSIM